jgi:hypothetical protein
VQFVHGGGNGVVSGDPIFDSGNLFELGFGFGGVIPEVGIVGQRLLLIEFQTSVFDMQVGVKGLLPLFECLDLFGSYHIWCFYFLCVGKLGTLRKWLQNYVLREKTDWTRLDINANVVSFLVYAILNRTGIINVLQNALPLK